MKTLISKTFIILALTSPVITVLAATTGFTITNNETIISNTGLKNPGLDENSISIVNYVNTETFSDTITTATDRKGWDGSVKGNSKGITQSGIKRTDADRKGWDGTVKGGNIQDESMNEINNPRSSEQQKANINTSRSNIKRGIRNPADSMQQKANINTSRSNIKRGIRNPADSMQQKANINTSRSNIKNQIRNPADSLQHTGAGDMPAQLQRGIDKKDIRKGMVDNTKTILPLRNDSTSQNTDRGVPANRLKTKYDTAKNSVGNIR